MLDLTGSDNDVSEYYWSVDIVGMTEEQARLVSSSIQGVGVELPTLLMNPRNFLTLHLDRESVRILASGLANLPGSAARNGLKESLDSWLDWADKVPEDDHGDSGTAR
jgi:hypothetical protein